MQHPTRAHHRKYQPLYSTLAGCACLLGPCLWLILPFLADAASVTKIYGSAVTLPSSIEPLCQAPAICPDFWDFRPTEGQGVIYGNRALSADTSCRKSTDGGRTFTLCPGAYPVTNVGREIDIPANGAILSMRFEATSANQCVIDKSTDAGVSWTTITIVAGANIQCAPASTQFKGEKLRCVGAICLAYVRNAALRSDIYRSADNGDTWALVSAGAAPSNCATAQGIFFDGGVGVATCHRNISLDATAARVSTDSGASWSYFTAPALPAVDHCGVASNLAGFDTSYALACFNDGSTLTAIRFLSTNANVRIPSSQPFYGVAYNPSSNPALFQLNSTNAWIFTLDSTVTGHVLFTSDSGQTLNEIPASVDGTFRPTGLNQGRIYQGALMVTVDIGGAPAFALLQGS